MNPPPLCQLGGEETFPQYQARFDQLYPTPVIDVLGRSVRFENESCHHVCFERPAGQKFAKVPRDQWRQECADRIEWIKHALTAPYEIRPGNRPGYDVYLVSWEVWSTVGRARDRFLVSAEVEGPAMVRFVTAYAANLDTWNKARDIGPCRYPPPKPKKNRGNNK